MSGAPGAAGGLSAEELELMALLLEEAGIDDAAPGTIPRRAPGARVPLTFAQRRLWFLEQLEPETRIYNDAFSHRLVGDLDVAALQAALDGLVERHESLRTVFVEEGGEPWQVVREGFRIPLEHHDLSHLPGAAQMEEVRRIADRATYTPFDLSRGPLLRPVVMRLGERDHAFVIAVHHIINDGWSLGIFFTELSALYDAARRGERSPLPPLPLQYGDFAVWQHEHLSDAAIERQMAYWKERLRGAPTVLELPTGRVRPAEQTYRGAGYDFTIPRSVAAGLHALAQEEAATLFMVVYAALVTLLGRYTCEEDIVVGSPIANRTRPELEGLIGLFANTLAVRADLSGGPTFRELLGRVRESTFEDFANQDLPFEKLVEGLKIERSLSYNPVFQVLLVVQNAPLPKSLLPGLDAGQLDVGHRKAKLDLALTLVETPEGMFGGWEYSTELIDPDTMVRIHDHFVTLLRGVVEDPDRRLSELPLTTPEERTRVLYTWNEGAGVESERRPVHVDFEARAALAPDAVAVQHAGESLAYAELSRRSSQLARHLRARGVGPESRVGVCLSRSPEMIVALLGVLKAGAAYVPLDPSYPRDRLAYMVEDSGIALILTETALFGNLPGSAAAEAVFLDGDRERIAQEEGTDPEVPVDPHCAAYVIYTSGSTGKPKGVVVPHRTMAWFVAAAREVYGITAADTVLQFASMNFDTSVEEIFPTLLSGGRLVLRTEEVLGSARIFLDACREWGITVLDLPTAYWHELVAELSAGDGAELPGGMRIVIIGGERALPERLRAWRERFGERVRLVNGYGPTETTVVATVADLTTALEEDSGTTSLRAVPIGLPLPHARVYVLDTRGEPSPVGVPGELYVGGGGVTRGYLGRPDLTAERFVPDPYGPDAGARLYRTGDRVRWLPDGSLEFVGRVDQQVKIRGFRVELGEIESLLTAREGVEDAVVVAREDQPGSVRLVAYMVPKEGAALSVPELRAALKEELPPYMVPAAWVTMDALPMTKNGKVDRRSLPAPEAAQAGEEGAQRSAPQSEVERTIAAAWREVLGVDEVGLDDNFFDLGGHSLLLARLRSRLAGKFPREVSVVVLFRYPTIRSLAEYLAQSEPEAAALPETSVEEVEDRRAALRRRRELRGELGG